MLAVGGHVLDDFHPRFVRMATGCAGGVGETKQEMCGPLRSPVRTGARTWRTWVMLRRGRARGAEPAGAAG